MNDKREVTYDGEYITFEPDYHIHKDRVNEPWKVLGWIVHLNEKKWFDRKIRRIENLDSDAYLHRSCKPLDEVDLTTPEDHGQMTFDNFRDECAGVCGV